MKLAFMLEDRYVFQHYDELTADGVFCGLGSICNGAKINGLWCCSPMKPDADFIRIQGEHAFGEPQVQLTVYSTLRTFIHTKAEQSWYGQEFGLEDEPSSFGSKVQ